MDEVSKCAKINCSSFETLHFPRDDVNIEIRVLETPIRKHLFSSLVLEIHVLYYSKNEISNVK